MPRADGGGKSTKHTREWRAKLKAQRRPEIDAVDMALAASIAVYRHTAESKASEKDINRANALEIMAINHLVSRGYNREHAEKRVLSRTRRLDVDKIIPTVI